MMVFAACYASIAAKPSWCRERRRSSTSLIRFLSRSCAAWRDVVPF